VLERIENTISRYNMIPAGTRLAVAVSGGADSVFLLHYLASRGDGALSVAHINHGLREDESDKDEIFVQELAAQLRVPFHVHRMAKPAGNVEQFCRRERQRFFAQLRAEGVADRVATGHTATDQAETVLMRCLRGAGTTGLRGILPVTAEGVIRPLLSTGREEIRRWLAANAIPWREDASNESAAFLRNRIRAQALPVLRGLDPYVEQALGRIAGMAAVDEEYWNQAAAAAVDRLGAENSEGWVMDQRELKRLHPALRSRAIREALRRVRGDLRRLDWFDINSIDALATGEAGEGCLDVPGARVLRSMNWVRMEPAGQRQEPYDLELPVPGNVIAGPWRIEIGLGHGQGYTKDEVTPLAWCRIQPPLRLRTWQAGDRLQTEGMLREKKVKDLFIRARVPSWDRRLWPMITDSEGIVWMHRFGGSARVTPPEPAASLVWVRCNRVFSK
jgi:tRNA(Ile)-lysidine synthase